MIISEQDGLIGKKFERLTVVGEAERTNRGYEYLCLCDCGNYIYASQWRLEHKMVKSCGCLRHECKGRPKVLNTYNLNGEYGIGYTTNTNNEFYFDLEDYDKIKSYSWCEHILSSGYHALEAWWDTVFKVVRMQWVIMNQLDGNPKIIYDHINHNPLDNRKCNLREATIAQNGYCRSKQKSNTSGITGVYKKRDKRKTVEYWRGQISKEGKRIVKDFHEFDDAVKWRLEMENKLFGEFSPQKHLFEKYGVGVDSGIF